MNLDQGRNHLPQMKNWDVVSLAPLRFDD